MKEGRWSEADAAYLRKNYRRRTVEELARDLDRKEEAIRAKAHRLQLYKRRPWTAREKEFLARHYDEFTCEELGELLARTESAIRSKAYALQVNGDRPRTWTDDEVAFLEEHYQEMTASEVGEVLGVSDRQVWNKAWALGLRKREPLSPEAEALLWELRDEPGTIEFFSQRFGVGEPALRRRIEELEEAGGPDRPVGNLAGAGVA